MVASVVARWPIRSSLDVRRVFGFYVIGQFR